jgi:uncharacterized membrane protein
MRAMKLKDFLHKALFSLNTLLLFFVVFENRLYVPDWLQVFGRMHPLLLHFPIVLIVAVAAMLISAPFFSWAKNGYPATVEWLLLTAALTATLAALMGLFLAAAGDYEKDAISWHKWTGIIISFMLFAVHASRAYLLKSRAMSLFCGLLTGAMILLAGHFGSEITHGENFVLAPVTVPPEKDLPSFHDALVFDHLVYPVLQTKCMSCHNSKKAKGKLSMETRELLLKGGKNGKLLDSSVNNFGLLLKRIHLPHDAKKHMPPLGKPQLTGEEIAMLDSWIMQGYDFDKKVSGLATSDTLYHVAKRLLPSGNNELYEFAAVDDHTVESLNNNSRLISPIALGSPALRVSFFNTSLFDISWVDELQPVSENVTEMNFLNMPVRDADLKKIGRFRNLRKLNLNFTEVTGATLAELSVLRELKSLSLSGTSLQRSHLFLLSSFPSLENVFLWNTAISADDIKTAGIKNKKIVFQIGFNGDSTSLKLNRPIFDNEQDVISSANFPVNIKHYIKGAAIRYTVDGKDPDSLLSLTYNGPVKLDRNTLIKARAFKKGWFSSDVTAHYFFKRTYLPDSAVLFTAAKQAFRARGIKTLIDGEKSEVNFASGKWLGFQDNDLHCLLFFNKPVMASNVTLSSLLDFSSYIFPPQKVQVWGGADVKNLKLLTTTYPSMPKTKVAKHIYAAECNFAPVTVSVIKIIAQPLARVPLWLQDLKEGGHLFVDEIFVN